MANGPIEIQPAAENSNRIRSEQRDLHGHFREDANGVIVDANGRLEITLCEELTRGSGKKEEKRSIRTQNVELTE